MDETERFWKGVPELFRFIIIRFIHDTFQTGKVNFYKTYLQKNFKIQNYFK